MNPLILREWHRLWSSNKLALLGVTAFWLILTLVLRVSLSRVAATTPNANVGLLASWLIVMLRPEFFVAPLLVGWVLGFEGWRTEVEGLLLTRLSPTQILVGKLLVPIALLATLNLLIAPLTYQQLLSDATLRTPGGPRWASVAPFWPLWTIVVLLLALMEDLAISTLATLVSASQLVARASRLEAVLHTLARLVGFGTCVSAWLFIAFEGASSLLPIDLPWALTMAICSFAAVAPLLLVEIALCLHFGRQCLGRLASAPS